MRKHVFRSLLFVTLLAVSFSSCKKFDLFGTLSQGFSDDIENFVPDSTIETLTNMGMIINEGKKPPNIEGSYLVSQLLMKATNVPDESYPIGHRFADYQYHFYDQNNRELSISLNAKGINTEGVVFTESTGDGAFLSGYDNDFTAFLIQEGYTLVEGDSAYYKTLEVFSGTITETGIEDFHSALIMLDDYGDPYDYYIPVNTGRVFYDSDGLATSGSTYKTAILSEKGKKALGIGAE